VVGRPRRERRKGCHARKQLAAEHRVDAHLEPFARGQRPGLVEDPVGHAERPDVVEEPGAGQLPPAGMADPLRHRRGERGHAVGVAGGPRRLRVDHFGEGVRQLREVRLGGVRARGLGRLVHDCCNEGNLVARELVEQRRVEQEDQGRVEPGAAAPVPHRERLVGPARRREHLGGLREQEDPAEPRNFFGPHAVGMAQPVPVLVQRVDRVAHGGREPSAAISRPHSQRSRISAACAPSPRASASTVRARDGSFVPGDDPQRPVRATAARGEVGEIERGFHGAIAGGEQRARARRVSPCTRCP
jgi:hypothetical protein